MENLGAELSHELQVEKLFSFNIGGFQADISESIVVSWIVMGVLIVLAIIITAGFRVRKLSGRQVLAEGYYNHFYGMVKNMLNHESMGYAPYICSVLFFIGLSNIFGIFGFKPPTKDINVTAALALMSIVLVQVASIRNNGVGGWLKGFGNNPMNILELFTRPLSLAMRLFGNVLGAFVVMELIHIVIPVGAPAVVSLYFDIFDGLLQAYVFTFLTSLFISETAEE